LELGIDWCGSATASKLGLSERTLRRRLSEEGTSFRNILVEARLAIGHELLSTAKLDVSTVAYRTGYSEPSSFVRAFTQHFGYSPGKIKFSAAG
jgi:AraC-like DNA-binding protein